MMRCAIRSYLRGALAKASFRGLSRKRYGPILQRSRFGRPSARSPTVVSRKRVSKKPRNRRDHVGADPDSSRAHTWRAEERRHQWKAELSAERERAAEQQRRRLPMLSAAERRRERQTHQQRRGEPLSIRADSSSSIPGAVEPDSTGGELPLMSRKS